MMFEQLQKQKKNNQKETALLDFPSEWTNYDFKQQPKQNLDDLHKTMDSYSKNHDISSKTDDDLKQLIKPKLNRMATIYLKNPLNNMKKNERKFKNELMKIPKTVKEELHFQTKNNNKANNEVSFPEVMRTTPQKPHKNEDFYTLESMKHNFNSNKLNENIINSNKLNENPINSSNKSNEFANLNIIPHKRASTHSNNSLLDLEKKTIVN